jgi:hypothetical protein
MAREAVMENKSSYGFAAQIHSINSEQSRKSMKLS